MDGEDDAVIKLVAQTAVGLLLAEPCSYQELFLIAFLYRLFGQRVARGKGIA